MSAAGTNIEMAVSTRSKSSSNDGSISKVKNSDTNNKTKITKISTSTPSIAWIDIFFFIILVLLSIFTYPSDFLTGHIKHVPISFVWYYGWITAVSTGLGALPFIFFKEPTKFWLGVSNGEVYITNLLCIVFNHQVTH